MPTRQPDPWADSLEVGDDIGELGGSWYTPYAKAVTVTKVTKTQVHTLPKGKAEQISKWRKATCGPVGGGSKWDSPSIVPLDDPRWVACRKKLLVTSYRRKIIKAVEGVNDLKVLKDALGLSATPTD